MSTSQFARIGLPSKQSSKNLTKFANNAKMHRDDNFFVTIQRAAQRAFQSATGHLPFWETNRL